jgi:hypothetical protein
VVDEALHALGLCQWRGEVAVFEHATLQDGEPDLDLAGSSTTRAWVCRRSEIVGRGVG